MLEWEIRLQGSNLHDISVTAWLHVGGSCDGANREEAGSDVDPKFESPPLITLL